MSADNWTICPRCNKIAIALVQPTLREDWELGMDRDGFFTAKYSGHCSTLHGGCGFSFQFKHAEDVLTKAALAQSLPTEHEPAPPVPESLVMDLAHIPTPETDYLYGTFTLKSNYIGGALCEDLERRLTIAREALNRLDEICSEKDGIRVFKVSGPMIKRITAEALTLTAPRP